MDSSEINTAVKRGLSAVRIVLNDARCNMCYQGMAALDMADLADACFPAVDFATLARSMAATGVRVESEDELENKAGNLSSFNRGMSHIAEQAA